MHYFEVHLHDKNQTERRNFVLEFLQDHSQISDSAEYETEFVARGTNVCWEAWLLVHNTSKETFGDFIISLKMVL